MTKPQAKRKPRREDPLPKFSKEAVMEWAGDFPPEPSSPSPASYAPSGDLSKGSGDYTYRLIKEIADLRRELDAAISSLRVLNEETVLAGYPSGDRDQTLANVRQMRAKLPAPPSAPETSKEKA